MLSFTSAYADRSDVEDFVTRFYQLCLNRDPDPDGLKGWVDALLDETLAGTDIAYGFIFSQEFIKKSTNDKEYLAVLYRAFFDREPDAAGLQGWQDALAGDATRIEVLDGFIYSKEFSELCQKFGIEPFNPLKAFVTRFYRLCLGREPDPAGLDSWIQSLKSGSKSGADVAEGFVDSPEFLNQLTNNEEFLLILYKAFFNRTPDSTGWNAWLADLNSGRNRSDVLKGFIFATEFIELCKSFGIMPFSDPDDDFDGDGYTPNQGDCNDIDANVHPATPEVCGDQIDNDCNQKIDEGCSTDVDIDNDGYTPAQGDCNDSDSGIYPGAAEACDGKDNNCNDTVDEGCPSNTDGDGDGYTPAQGDCNDSDGDIYPGAAEACDGKDNNCNNEVDEGCPANTDGDNDGYTPAQGDCNDSNGNIHPGAAETCDGVDNNCDGTVDEGCQVNVVQGGWSGGSSSDATEIKFSVSNRNLTGTEITFDMSSEPTISSVVALPQQSITMDSANKFTFSGTFNYTPNPYQPWITRIITYTFNGEFVNAADCTGTYNYTVHLTPYSGNWEATPQ